MKTRRIMRWVLGVVVIAVVVAMILNREWIVDFTRGVLYSPSSEMARIRDDLELTERGTFLFNASRPVLSERESFNERCRFGYSSENAVLGCYRENAIYVYNIDDEELAGIRELTTAHELLHANWARMSEEERVALVTDLTHVFEDNQEMLAEEINTYETSEKQEELYVRAGTEVADLPKALEEHYAEIFKDQDRVVGFYDKYITKFRTLEQEMEQLKAKIDALGTRIESLEAEYDNRAEQFNMDVASFNNCAETAGCFVTEADFYGRRNVLVNEEQALDNIYEEINNMIYEYNGLVEKYNADVVQSDILNKKINSSVAPEEVE